MDFEHGRLIESARAACAGLQRGPREPVLDSLGLLYERSCAHFALEEKLLRDRACDTYAQRKAEHEALLESVRTMMDSFYDGACDYCDKSLGDCLLSWLGQHLQADHGDLTGGRRE